MAINSQLEIWSDLDHRVVLDSQSAVKKVINIEAVLTSIENILRTAPGERVFLPTFALGLGDLLFEPITNRLLSKISDSIKNAIETWDDRVIIDGVDFKSDPDMSSVDVTLTLRIRGFYETVVHTVKVNP